MNIVTKSLATLFAVSGLYLLASSEDDKLNKTKEKETISGCLAKGLQESEFYLTDEKTGQRMSVSGALDKHLNHKVKLTGKQEMESGRIVFKVSAVEMIADSCTAS